MASFLELIKRQAMITNKSIGELAINVPYKINSMEEVLTKFGLAITCRIEDAETRLTVNIFLPSYIKISVEQSKQVVSGSLGVVHQHRHHHHLYSPPVMDRADVTTPLIHYTYIQYAYTYIYIT